VTGGPRIERVVTTDVFQLDGGTWGVDNNIWLIGDDHQAVVVDAAHDVTPIIDAVGDRDVVAVVCTQGHNDHVNVAPRLGKRARKETPAVQHTPGQALTAASSAPAFSIN
jgi:glyoxylase-like metal-dependent hydrolase (beta-lactamase superfamily II)